MGVWDGLDECEISRPEILFQSAPGCTPSTHKNVAAIATNHFLVAGRTIGRNDLVVKFLKGARRLNPPRPRTVPTWNLSVVLRALREPPSSRFKQLAYGSCYLKTALLFYSRFDFFIIISLYLQKFHCPLGSNVDKWQIFWSTHLFHFYRFLTF